MVYRRFRWLQATLALSLAWLPAGSARGESPAAPLQRMDSVRYRLHTPGSDIDTGGAWVLVHAPLPVVRKIVQRFEHYEKYLPGMEQSRIVRREKGATDLYMRAPVLHGAVTLWGVLHFMPPQKRGVNEIIRGELREGNLDACTVEWRLAPCGEQETMVRLEAYAELKIPLPASIYTPEFEYIGDKAVSAVRDRAECAYRSQRRHASAQAEAAPPPATPPPTTVTPPPATAQASPAPPPAAEPARK